MSAILSIIEIIRQPNSSPHMVANDYASRDMGEWLPDILTGRLVPLNEVPKHLLGVY